MALFFTTTSAKLTKINFWCQNKNSSKFATKIFFESSKKKLENSRKKYQKISEKMSQKNINIFSKSNTKK